jgi:hypothetical protein
MLAPNARDVVQRLEHDLLGGRARHRALVAECVPDFAVVIGGPFEEPTAPLRGVDDANVRQRTPELRPHAALQIRESWIFRGEVRRHDEWLVNVR